MTRERCLLDRLHPMGFLKLSYGDETRAGRSRTHTTDAIPHLNVRYTNVERSSHQWGSTHRSHNPGRETDTKPMNGTGPNQVATHRTLAAFKLLTTLAPFWAVSSSYCNIVIILTVALH